jgi:hypothetical protein
MNAVASAENGAKAARDPASMAQLVGRTIRCRDRVTPVPLAALAATLDRDEPAPNDGSPIAPMRHWLYFLPLHRRSETGPDGHALRGDFLPPVSLPRRMWAGGRLEFHRPILVGEPIERVSTIVKVDPKHGRSGALVFVVVRHEISAAGELAITEEHDIVYRDAARADEPPAPKAAAPRGATWWREIVPDPALLFRSPHPLRLALRYGSRALSRPHRPRSADRDAARGSRPRSRGAGPDRHVRIPGGDAALRCGAVRRLRSPGPGRPDGTAVGAGRGRPAGDGGDGDAALTPRWRPDSPEQAA